MILIVKVMTFKCHNPPSLLKKKDSNLYIHKYIHEDK